MNEDQLEKLINRITQLLHEHETSLREGALACALIAEGAMRQAEEKGDKEIRRDIKFVIAGDYH